MPVTLDENDPCGTATRLRQAYTDLIAGQTPSGVIVRGAGQGTEKEVRFHAPNASALLKEVLRWETKCQEATTGAGRRPRRFAARAGGRTGGMR